MPYYKDFHKEVNDILEKNFVDLGLWKVESKCKVPDRTVTVNPTATSKDGVTLNLEYNMKDLALKTKTAFTSKGTIKPKVTYDVSGWKLEFTLGGSSKATGTALKLYQPEEPKKEGAKDSAKAPKVDVKVDSGCPIEYNKWELTAEGVLAGIDAYFKVNPEFQDVQLSAAAPGLPVTLGGSLRFTGYTQLSGWNAGVYLKEKFATVGFSTNLAAYETSFVAPLSSYVPFPLTAYGAFVCGNGCKYNAGAITQCPVTGSTITIDLNGLSLSNLRLSLQKVLVDGWKLSLSFNPLNLGKAGVSLTRE